MSTSSEIRLDIGCGREKKPGFTGVDISQDSDADVIASALDLPFEDSSVSEIYCAHLVEHFRSADAQVFFNEIYRVLKNGGTARLKIDRDWSEKKLLGKDPTHQKRYSVQEIKDMVRKFSVSIVERKIYRYGWHIRTKIFVELKK